MISWAYLGWLPARFETMRIECGFVVRLKGEVGEVRRADSFVRIWGGKVVVFGGQRVLSLSKTRARIVGGFDCCCWKPFSVLPETVLLVPGVRFAAPTRGGPRSSGR